MIADTLIVGIANQSNPNVVALNKLQRNRLICELPIHVRTNAEKLSDVWLCREVITAWSVAFAERAFGTPFKGPVNLRKK